MIQFVSHVRRPSNENDCSHRAVRVDHRPLVADADVHALEDVVALEAAGAVLESPDDRLVEAARRR
jgi:hypothetical protein